MKRIITVAIIFCFAFTSNTTIAQTKEKIKIACIGNSITAGARIQDQIKDAYPAQLGRMLGENYEVKNFGVSGRTLLTKGNMPYVKTGAYKLALEFEPDIIFIKLGTNDSKPYNWKFGDEFKTDYLKLLESFQNLKSKPTIHLCLAVPVFKSGMTINDEIVEHTINPLIKEIASEQNLKLVDLFSPFVGKKELFPDHIHPNAQGAGELAKIIYKQITGTDGKLVSQSFPGKQSTWKGFKRFDFEFNKKEARIIEPSKPLKGNPWVWRARFPGWHTAMDSILVSEGYHLAYINTNGQFGSPKAMKTWDRYYKYLTRVHHFSGKVALEGVSRGGLFVYNWAKKHPDLVSCIYAEAPVCDFKSWPAGFGASNGSVKDWQKLKEEYGFASDDEAKNYNDNPIDSLEVLAQTKVPVLHMIGLNDSVVPVTENSFKLINEYVKLGGIATIIPCTNGKQTLFGHHFPIETPRVGADFIKYHTETEIELLESDAYHKQRGGLQNSFIKFQREKTGRVAFLGGSITYNGGWRDSICNYLQNRFPDTEFDFIAAGIPSMGSTPAAFRMERDIFVNGPVDLLFEEAAVNDAGNGRSNTEQIRAMEGIVRQARSKNPATDVVIMHFVDPGKMKIYHTGGIPKVIQNHEKVAAHYNIPTINLAKEVGDRIDAGEFTWKYDFRNLHPSPFGQNIYFLSMKRMLENAWNTTIVDDDIINNHEFPAPLDERNYCNGVLLDINTAKISGDWKIVENWEPQDGKATRTNYTKVPMLIGKKAKGKVALEFEGNTVGIAVAAGPDAGIIEYRLDKGNWIEYDLRKNANKQLHLPRYNTIATNLTNTVHKIELRMKKTNETINETRACRIRYFFVNQTESNSIKTNN